MHLVCQVFNDKTVAALKTLKDKLGINDGTIIFVKLVTLVQHAECEKQVLWVSPKR